MVRLRSSGETRSAESRVFQSSGWLSPHQFAKSANENALEPPQTTTVITGLEPYTQYKFRVLAVNMAGSVSSPWTTERTGESGDDQCFKLYVGKLLNESIASSQVNRTKARLKSKSYKLTYAKEIVDT